jgi:hypothetical protein
MDIPRVVTIIKFTVLATTVMTTLLVPLRMLRRVERAPFVTCWTEDVIGALCLPERAVRPVPFGTCWLHRLARARFDLSL